MGADYPVGEDDPVAFVKTASNLSAAQRDAVCGQTAAALLALTGPNA